MVERPQSAWWSVGEQVKAQGTSGAAGDLGLVRLLAFARNLPYDPDQMLLAIQTALGQAGRADAGARSGTDPSATRA